MKDSTITTKVLQIVSYKGDNKDSVSFSIDKGIVNKLTQDKGFDYSHVIDVTLPVFAALLTLFLTRIFDNMTEKRKYRREILKENRRLKIKFLKYLNTYRTNLLKPVFPEADYDDQLDWVADSMVTLNPFDDLANNSNIIFENRAILNLVGELHSLAAQISYDFDWQNKEHGRHSHGNAEQILTKLAELITLISNDIKQ